MYTIEVKALHDNEQNWKLVRETARGTVGKDDIDKPVSDAFKKTMILSQHSCIRELRYMIKLKGIPTFVAQQFSRHKVATENPMDFMAEKIAVGDDEPYVKTQRSDRTGVKRDKLPQDTPVDMIVTCNAQGLIDMSKKRLCAKADSKAREIWIEVTNKMFAVDWNVALSMMPSCCWFGFCPEGANEKCLQFHYPPRKIYLETFLEKK